MFSKQVIISRISVMSFSLTRNIHFHTIMIQWGVMVVVRLVFEALVFIQTFVVLYFLFRGNLSQKKTRYRLYGLYALSILAQIFQFLNYQLELYMGMACYALLYTVYLYCILMEMDFLKVFESISPISAKQFGYIQIFSTIVYLTFLGGIWGETLLYFTRFEEDPDFIPFPDKTMTTVS